MSFFFVVLPAMILIRQWFAGENGQAPGEQSPLFVAAEIVLVAVAASVMAGSLVWGFRRGLSFGESVRVLFGATTQSPGWNEPHIARLLTSAGGGIRSPDRDSASDHRRAIEELAATLPSAARAIGSDVVSMARRLLGAIEACDAEVVSLTHLASASELDRLTAQLATLGGDGREGRNEKSELQGLVRRQLEVVRRMRDQSELTAQRRARLLNLLRGLWTQLSATRDESADDATSVARVRTVLAEAALELETGR